MSALLNITLHAHVPCLLPGSQQPRRALQWLHRSISETYLPILRALDDLQEIFSNSPALTVSLSPRLIQALDNEHLRRDFEKEMNARIGHYKTLAETLKGSPSATGATFYARRAKALLKDYRAYRRDIAGAFARHAHNGTIRLIPDAGTHAPLPMLATDTMRRAHIRAGVQAFKDRFGLTCSSIWLPACAYAPGLDKILAEEGIQQVILAPSSLQGANARAEHGLLAPCATPNGLSFLTIHPDLARPIFWAQEETSHYRDLPANDSPSNLEKSLQHDQEHNGLLQQHTGTSLYKPAEALAQSRRHARAFLQRAQQIAATHTRDPEPAVLTCAWPMEVFGAVWLEGPPFLKELLQKAALSPHWELGTLDKSLEEWPSRQILSPGPGSWHKGGFFDAWLDPSFAWTHRHTRSLERKIANFSPLFHGAKGRWQQRALVQATQNLMLAQSSDWFWLIRNERFGQEAIEGFKNTLKSAQSLLKQAHSGQVERDELQRGEETALFEAKNLEWIHPKP